MKILILILSVITISCSHQNSLREIASSQGQVVEHNGYKYLVTSECYDQDRVFKSCKNQQDYFQKALLKAKKLNKDLLVIYGRERCVWCQNINKLLRDSDISDELQQLFIIKTIDQRAIDESGKTLGKSLKESAGVVELKGVPLLFVVNAQSGHVRAIHLETAERNAWDPSKDQDSILNPYYGYDAQKVLQLIEQ